MDLRVILRFYVSVQMFYLQTLGNFKNIQDKICLKQVVWIISNSLALLSLSQVFHKIAALKKFTNFKGKLLQRCPFFVKLLFWAYTLQLYWERDSDTGVSSEVSTAFKNSCIGHVWTTAFVFWQFLANVSAILMWQSKKSKNHL